MAKKAPRAASSTRSKGKRGVGAKTRADDERLREELRHADMKQFDKAHRAGDPPYVCGLLPPLHPAPAGPALRTGAGGRAPARRHQDARAHWPHRPSDPWGSAPVRCAAFAGARARVRRLRQPRVVRLGPPYSSPVRCRPLSLALRLVVCLSLRALLALDYLQLFLVHLSLRSLRVHPLCCAPPAHPSPYSPHQSQSLALHPDSAP